MVLKQQTPKIDHTGSSLPGGINREACKELSKVVCLPLVLISTKIPNT